MKIYDKRWYYGLKPSKDGEYKNNLLDEFKLSDVSKHLIICLEPNKLPGQHEQARTKKGKLFRYFALFDSYLDFYMYMLKFPIEDRNFYEVILGDLPQKPHFDIDIEKKDIDDESIEYIGNILYQAVIKYSIEVLEELSVTTNIETDILIYSSHGADKRSYHIIINNKCHDGNEEAKAFYDAVVNKITDTTNAKYIKFIDRSVYSKKQQFRVMGCQKYGTQRPKRFLEKFKYNNVEYVHKYIEEFRNDDMKKLAILYESLISFVSGCSYIQSLIKPKIYHNYSTNNFLDDITIDRCMKMLKEKMNYCPFSISSVDEEKRTIYLKREAPSYCPICQKRKPHESRDPLIYIFKGGVYWNCLRHNKGIPNLYLGDLSMNIIELQNLNINSINNNAKCIDSGYDEPETECYKIPNEPKLNEPNPNEPNSNKPSSNEQNSNEVKLNKQNSNEPKSNQPKLNEQKLNEPKLNEPKSNEPKSNNPKSNEPKSNESIKDPRINITKNINELLSNAVKEASIKKVKKNNNKLEECENVLINSMLSWNVNQ